MTGDKFLDILEYVDHDLIAAASPELKAPFSPPTGGRKRKPKPWVKWTAAAACLCLVIGGAVAARGGLWNRNLPAQENYNLTQSWRPDMTAADYFKNNRAPKNGTMGASSSSLAYAPFAASVSLSDQTKALKVEGILPEMPEYPEPAFEVDFNGDGSLYKVYLQWDRRGERENYSTLRVTAAPREIREISDVISIALDKNGDVIDPNVTVTERDGVYITAEGYENGPKTLTWQNDSGWYQVEGSWNDGYEALVPLLDWFWDHPLNLDRYAALGKDIFILSTPAEYPAAFADALPDFAALGYAAESERLYLTNGAHPRNESHEDRPVYFEGRYVRETDGTRICWEVDTTMDGYDLVKWNGSRWVGRALGWLQDLTEDAVAAEVSAEGSVLFDYKDLRITLWLEDGAAADAWEIIRSIQ